jgi:uncharacterized membrane protein SirB2
MSDPSLYLAVKVLHQIAATVSVTLFAGRWLGVLRQAAWPMRAQVRRTSVGVDTLLLLAGLSLWGLGHWHPGHDVWLGTKLALLPLYVLLGSLALKRARTGFARLCFGALALATVAQMAGVALHHHPAGWLAPALEAAR